MTLYAVLSDIHANYQALEAVVRDARQAAEKERSDVTFISLGDVVDYGPQPNECMEWVRENVRIVVQGNHDRAAVAPFREPPSQNGVGSDLWPITLWTRKTLLDPNKEAIREWNSERMGPEKLKHFTLLHSSLTDRDAHISFKMAASMNMKALRTAYALFGHTHFQGYFVESWDNTVRMYLACSKGDVRRSTDGWMPADVGEWHELPDSPALLNPGSVGQPRSHALLAGAGVERDCRAAYMLLKVNGGRGGKFQFRRVAYDVDETVRRLREVRWEAEEKKSAGSEMLYGSDKGVRFSDPLARFLDEVLANIDSDLPHLINKTLIPTLKMR